MKLIKRGVYALLVALPLAVSMFIFPNAAQATSDYDNLLHTSPTLFVYADGATKSQKMDISQSWYNSLGQTYAKRLEQNIGWPTNFMTELNAIKSSGGSLGLFMQETQDGNLVGVVGSRDPHAYCEFAGNISLGKFMCSTHAGYGYVYAYYFTHNTYGGNGCAYGSGICSNDGMAIYDAPVVQTGTEGYTIFGIPYSNLASYKFYFMDFDVTYPSGYAGAILPTSPPPAKYVAMGDSFSSGEGNPPFEAGTDVDNVNLCHRSTTAYPRQVQNALNLGSTAFVACSGAVSDYIINEYNQENTELPQAAFVSSSTNLVTITIGGNDVGFGSVLTSCTLPTNESGTTEEKHQIEHDACIRAIDDAQTTASSAALQSKLETVFSGIRSLGSSNLQVVVAGYPNLLPTFTDITGTCVWGDGYPNTSGRAVASDETQAARQLHDDLNATIAAAVSATNDNHIHYVDPSSAFAGHELCRPDPWLYNVIPHLDTIDRRSSYHPNASGQAAYASVIEAEVNSFS